ncbi:hypothetical protein HYT84_00915 [Candidatus Micrarchaeota archaeon]|nr:hypothetical protein [Candidatus Micrarchaeota archaeon]
MTVRITITIDEVVLKKLREIGSDNISAFINTHLKSCLFENKESMAGILAGKVSTKDIIEDEEHEH